MIENSDSLEFLKKQADFSVDINYSDPPYALGSEIMIRSDGKVDYKKANDFMSKWEMPTGEYWEQWFKEAYRSLKYGGYCVMFGMDRQLLLFKYYAQLAGFSERQSLYWFFISNFPKATDLSKMIDKNAGAEREVVGKRFDGKGSDSGTGIYQMNSGESEMKQEIDITAPSTDLAKKYSGYKYSISPLKQTNETIMVFQKPYKTGSCLHDTLAYENGDTECCCGALDIDGNRVGTTTEIHSNGKRSMYGGNSLLESKTHNTVSEERTYGRYPSQTFCNSETAEVLGDQSKILHKCDFEKDEHDLYFYCPKVSKSERNAGCEEMEEQTMNNTSTQSRTWNDRCATCGKKFVGSPETICHCPPELKITDKTVFKWKNNHPTLKPISLNERILKLFKTPNPQKIIYPFAGSGSEVIGGWKAGFTNWQACELNPEYVEIAKARIKHWSK